MKWKHTFFLLLASIVNYDSSKIIQEIVYTRYFFRQYLRFTFNTFLVYVIENHHHLYNIFVLFI